MQCKECKFERVIAGAISWIFHPVFVFPALIVLLFFKERAYVEMLYVLAMAFGGPFAWFLWLFVRGRIGNFDVTDRAQRYPIYAVSLIGMTASVVYLYFYGTQFVLGEFLRLVLLGFVLVAVNFKVKVSIHTAMAVVLVAMLIKFYGVDWFVVSVVPLVALSRIILKRHSRVEIALGVLLPAVFYWK